MRKKMLREKRCQREKLCKGEENMYRKEKDVKVRKRCSNNVGVSQNMLR